MENFAVMLKRTYYVKKKIIEIELKNHLNQVILRKPMLQCRGN